MWQEHLYLVTFVGTLCCLIFIVALFIKKNALDSIRISLVVWLGFNLVMLFIEPLIYAPTGQIGLDRFIWYGGFAALDALAIFCINCLHKRQKIKLNEVSLLISLAFFVIMLLQVARYFDRQVLGTDVLGDVYSKGIPFIMVLTWAYVIAVVTLDINAKKQGMLK
jgi:uncharacterized membrane protein (DUF485 family)